MTATVHSVLARVEEAEDVPEVVKLSRIADMQRMSSIPHHEVGHHDVVGIKLGSVMERDSVP